MEQRADVDRRAGAQTPPPVPGRRRAAADKGGDEQLHRVAEPEVRGDRASDEAERAQMMMIAVAVIGLIGGVALVIVHMVEPGHEESRFSVQPGELAGAVGRGRGGPRGAARGSGHAGGLPAYRRGARAQLLRVRRRWIWLREGLLKENIDGEALLWAHERLLARPEQRRILMVISDGAPVDDSTLSVNTANYLERHLRDVIEWIETRSPVQLVAIGIGHDVTRYYLRAVTLEDAEQLGGTMMVELAEEFDEDEGQPNRRARARAGASGAPARRARSGS